MAEDLNGYFSSVFTKEDISNMNILKIVEVIML